MVSILLDESSKSMQKLATIMSSYENMLISRATPIQNQSLKKCLNGMTMDESNKGGGRQPPKSHYFYIFVLHT